MKIIIISGIYKAHFNAQAYYYGIRKIITIILLQLGSNWLSACPIGT